MPTSIAGWPVVVTGAVLSGFSLVVARNHLSALCVLLLLPGVFVIAFLIVRISRGTPPTLRGVRTIGQSELPASFRGKRFQLVAMPINHFGERLRWCLDLLQVPYEECTVGGLVSAFLRGRSVPWLVDRTSCSVIGNSDEALMYLSVVHVPLMTGTSGVKAKALLRRDAETIAWEAKLNALGHAVQGWAYHYVLGNASSMLCLTAWGAYEPRVPFWDRLALRVCCSVFKSLMWKAFKLRDIELLEKRRRVILGLLDEVDAALGKHTYILGDDLSYVDISFCALLAPLLGSSVCFRSEKSLYANGRFSSFDGQVEAHRSLYPVEIAKFEQEVLARPSGRFVLRLYSEARSMPL